MSLDNKYFLFEVDIFYNYKITRTFYSKEKFIINDNSITCNNVFLLQTADNCNGEEPTKNGCINFIDLPFIIDCIYKDKDCLNGNLNNNDINKLNKFQYFLYNNGNITASNINNISNYSLTDNTLNIQFGLNQATQDQADARVSTTSQDQADARG